MLIGLLLTKAESSHPKYKTVGGCWFQSVWHYRKMFSIFRNICCAFTAHLFLRNYSLQFYNNRLLFYVEKCLQLTFSWAKTNQARHMKPVTTSRRFKCVPQNLGSLSIHIFKLLFFLITHSCRAFADHAAHFAERKFFDVGEKYFFCFSTGTRNKTPKTNLLCRLIYCHST